MCQTFSCNYFKSNFFSLIIRFKVNFIHFPHAFALVSLRSFSVLNSRLPGPRWWARSHIVLEYNIENMRFIRLLLANQIAYIFRSNDKKEVHCVKWIHPRLSLSYPHVFLQYYGFSHAFISIEVISFFLFLCKLPLFIRFTNGWQIYVKKLTKDWKKRKPMFVDIYIILNFDFLTMFTYLFELNKQKVESVIFSVNNKYFCLKYFESS